jgi:hypothetical protein
MPAPAVNITTAASPIPRSSPTDTGVAYVVGMSTQGPSRLLTGADKVTSLNDWITRYGGGSLANARLSYSVDYDWIDTFFREGGNALYYGRVVGPTPVYASINLAGTGTTLVVTADEYGSYFNQFKIKVINGPVGGSGTRVVQLFQNDGTTLIDQTAEVGTQAGFSALKLGVAANVPMTITLGGGSGLPTVASATALSSGTDDRANITQTQVNAALANLFTDLGPGQVSSPNWQTSTAHLALLGHAATYGRFALCDPVDTTTLSTVTTNAAALKGSANGSYGALYHPWVQIPSLTTGGSARSVPPSALVAGKIAQNDPTDTPSQSPAGQWGTAQFAANVNTTWARVPAGSSNADTLADAGVNLIVIKNGAVMIYDIWTLAATDDEFQQVGVSRWRMQTVAQIRSEADSEIFARINRNTLTYWKGAAEGILLRQYGDNQLFGDLNNDRPDTAFNVDVDTPNTATTINAGQMNMNVAARPVKGGRILNISITAVPITAAVA